MWLIIIRKFHVNHFLRSSTWDHSGYNFFSSGHHIPGIDLFPPAISHLPGISASDLHLPGISASDLHLPGISASDLHLPGISASDLHLPGISASDLTPTWDLRQRSPTYLGSKRSIMSWVIISFWTARCNVSEKRQITSCCISYSKKVNK